MSSRNGPPWIKICGITNAADARAAEAAGADAIGLNFVRESKRFITRAVAAEIRQAVSSVEIVGVVADAPADWMRELLHANVVDRLQLHGHESDDAAAEFGLRAFRAVRIGDPDDVERARTAYGDVVLVDAAHGAALGGTGQPFDWNWVQGLAGERRVIVAGGLHPGNVAECIARVRPYGVDVASGVERSGSPGQKDPERIEAFIRSAREAAASFSES